MLPCCLLLIWWKFLINEPDKIHHRSRVTRDSTSWDEQACIHDALWRQHYITTSKEYLTNSHILSIYFELAFLQLRLVKISCKLIIIWVHYERNKKGARFLETQCSYWQNSMLMYYGSFCTCDVIWHVWKDFYIRRSLISFTKMMIVSFGWCKTEEMLSFQDREWRYYTTDTWNGKLLYGITLAAQAILTITTRFL